MAMTSALPPLVIVSGAPASGKSTLARLLATSLRLPLLTKDRFKETLGEALPAADRQRSRELGAAAYALLYATAGWLLDSGCGLMLESNFYRGESETALRPLLARSRPALVHCEAAPALLIRRYQKRHERGERHPVHHDAASLDELPTALAAGRFEPFELPVQTLRVNTTDGYAPSLGAIIAFIGDATAGAPAT